MDFVHLHLHTEYSLLDGLTKIKPLIATVKDMGMKAVAITDHGNMYGAIEFYKACLKNDIKPIVGCEVYYSPLGHTDKSAASRRANHLVLLAKDYQGYQNLMRIVSLANLEGFYYKPRIDWDIIKQYHSGLICLSGCVEGEIAQLILDDHYQKAKTRAVEFQQLFDEDYYLEIQRHPGLKSNDQANIGIIKLSQELGIPLVATNDSHYLRKEDAFAQDIILMINTQTTVNDKKRLSMLDIPDFYVKSPQEMADLYPDLPQAINNTQKIAEKCNLEIEIGKWCFPQFKLPPKETADSYLTQLTNDRAKQHYGSISSEVRERLDHELDVIISKGYATYFLIMEDWISWAKNNDLVTNTRGSAAGSLVSFVLGITSVDPLIYQLPFERFLNKDRPSPPDIDLDVSDDKRLELLHHIVKQYGEKQVAQICTFGRMMARASVRDTARVLSYEYAIGDKISKLIPLGSQGFPMSINKALNTSPELKNLYDRDPDAKKILEHAKGIEGNARHISVHACAIVISPTNLNDYTPIQFEPGGDKIITQYEMHAIEDVGLIKFDILGIDNLSFLGQAVLNVKKNKTIDIDLRKIPLDDPRTFAMLSKGDTMGVFQLSGEGMTKWLKELKPNRIEDLMAMVALYRPGPMSIIPEYIARKNNPSQISYFDPKMEKWLKKSYGLLVYQDDCLYTAIEIAGYNWVEVDKFRKAIGKKIPEEMAAQKEKFIQGCVNNGYSQHKAEEIFKLIEPFTSYGFNKAHAASYGMLAYQTAYMKANFPVEYMCALLTGKADDLETIAAGVAECRRMKIIVSPPDINKSYKGFVTEANPDSLQNLAIRFGFDAIKNVGDVAIELILAERLANGPFKNFTDLCLRVDGQKVNKKVLESLIKVGALDSFGPRAALLAAIDKIRADCDRQNQRYLHGQFGLFEDATNPSPPPPLDNLPDVPEIPEKDKLTMEKELLGIYVSDNPINKMLESFKNLTLPKISQVLDRPPGSQVKFSAVISRLKVIRTKKDNQKMAFVTLEDETGQIDAVVFPKTFQQTEEFLSENKPFYLEGRLTDRDDTLSVSIETISQEAPDQTKKYDFIIQVPPQTSQSTLMTLNQLLKNHPNGHRGLIILPNGKNFPLTYGVAYNPKLQAQIDTLLKIE